MVTEAIYAEVRPLIFNVDRQCGRSLSECISDRNDEMLKWGISYSV